MFIDTLPSTISMRNQHPTQQDATTITSNDYEIPYVYDADRHMLAPNVSQTAYNEAKDICSQIELHTLDKNSEKPRTLAEVFTYIANEVIEHNPEVLQDLLSIVKNAEPRQARIILENIQRGLVVGPKVMKRFSAPFRHTISTSVIGDNTNLMVGLVDEFSTSLEQSFVTTYTQSLSTFAGLLENNGQLQYPLFEGSKKERTIGYTSIDDAVYALQVTNSALLRAFNIGTPKDVNIVNPNCIGACEIVYDSTSFSDKNAKPVSVYVRPRTEKNKMYGEYGKGREAQASISIKVPLDLHDRRMQKRAKPSLVPDRPLNKIFSEQLAYETQSEVSIRIDFEGDVKDGKRGISLDIGAIIGEVDGLSFVVGQLFATGDIRSAKRSGRNHLLNHGPIDRKVFGDATALVYLPIH